MVDLHDYFRGYLDNVEPVLDVFFLTLHAIGLFTDILMPCMARSIFRCFSNSILNRSSILVLFCVLFEVHLQWGWGTLQQNHQCVGPSRARHGCASSFFEEDSQTGQRVITLIIKNTGDILGPDTFLFTLSENTRMSRLYWGTLLRGHLDMNHKMIRESPKAVLPCKSSS